MTNFTNVVELNKKFNRTTTTEAEFNKEALVSQLELIEEEVQELIDAIEDGDWTEIKDAIGDILVVTYGMGYVANIDCDKLMDNISNSNFSKFCTEAEMIETAAYYMILGVDTVAEETTINGEMKYAVKSARGQTYTEAGKSKTISEGKLLKNVNWKEPDLNVEI